MSCASQIPSAPRRRAARPIGLALRAAGVSLAALALGGCAGTSYYRSEPVSSSSEARTIRGDPATPDHSITTTLPGLDLSIEAQNRATSIVWAGLPIPIHGTRPPYARLPIWIEVAPHEQPVRFDPAGVTVVGAQGDTLRPIAWWGPGIGRGGPKGCECGVPRDSSKADLDDPYWERRVAYRTQFKDSDPPPVRAAAGPIEVSNPTCFLLVFDGRRAGLGFTVMPGSVGIGAEQRRLPSRRFQKRLTGELIPVGPYVWI